MRVQSALIVYAKKKAVHFRLRPFRPVRHWQLLLDYARNSIQFECKYVFANATPRPAVEVTTHSAAPLPSACTDNTLRACLPPVPLPLSCWPQACGFVWPRL